MNSEDFETFFQFNITCFGIRLLFAWKTFFELLKTAFQMLLHFGFLFVIWDSVSWKKISCLIVFFLIMQYGKVEMEMTDELIIIFLCLIKQFLLGL